MESEVMVEPALALVSFEQAELLQRVGFNYKTKYYYFNNPTGDKPTKWNFQSKPTGYDVDWNSKDSYGLNDANGWNSMSAPEVGLALKWLREKHSLWVTVFPDWSVDDDLQVTNGQWGADARNMKNDTKTVYGKDWYGTFEQAESAGLDLALDYLLNEHKTV